MGFKYDSTKIQKATNLILPLGIVAEAEIKSLETLTRKIEKKKKKKLANKTF